MSNLKLADLESFEELDDADLATVIGGTSTVGSVAGTVTGTISDFGNGAKPVAGLVILVGTTLVLAGTYLNQVGQGIALGLQTASGGLDNIAKGL
jgi:bacteriocin-like protein